MDRAPTAPDTKRVPASVPCSRRPPLLRTPPSSSVPLTMTPTTTLAGTSSKAAPVPSPRALGSEVGVLGATAKSGGTAKVCAVWTRTLPSSSRPSSLSVASSSQFPPTTSTSMASSSQFPPTTSTSGYVSSGVVRSVQAADAGWRSFQELAQGLHDFHQAMSISCVPVPFPYAQIFDMLLVLHGLLVPLQVNMATSTITWTGILSFRRSSLYGQ